jgi:cation diffusion facilitator family transporter
MGVGADDPAERHVHAPGGSHSDGSDEHGHGLGTAPRPGGPARDGQAHPHPHHRGVRRLVTGVLHAHSHDHGDSIDEEALASREGLRVLWVSLAALLGVAVVQALIVMISHSVGLLADTIHNFADALTAVPIGLAFLLGRRRPTHRYTYGFGRAEDLAGLSVVVVIAFSAAAVVWESISRLAHPHAVGRLWAVALAGVLGWAGNETVARYRIGVGRRIGSAALVADGRHARVDGFTSLAVVVGAVGVAAGWPDADPIVGLLISVAILGVLWGAGRDVMRRLMDAVEPETVDLIRRTALEVDGVVGVDHVRVRWLGHELSASLDLTVPVTLSIGRAHEIAETVHHHLLHEVPRLADVTIHTNPTHADGDDPHALTAHHRHRPR